MQTHIRINEIDKVEILTLQDNYIDLTAMDNSEIPRWKRKWAAVSSSICPARN